MRRPLRLRLRLRPAVVAASVAVASLLPACSSIDSEDIDTDAIQADVAVRVRNDGTASDVTATLSAGAFTFIDLGGDDRLVARAADTSVELQESDLLGAVRYDGVLDGVAAVDTEVTVAFERTAFAAAPASTVTLPARVALAAPAAGTAFSRANDDLVVTLAAADATDGARVAWSGDCIEAGGLDLPAGQAEVTIARGTLTKAAPTPDADAPAVPDSCALTLTVERVRTGVLDGAFGGGQIRALTSDKRDLTTNP
jgi:hypothetical protein